MGPLPPGLFSTTTGWPSVSPIFGASRRASVSATPPGNGTTILTGLAGNAPDCAGAATGSAQRTATIRTDAKGRMGAVLLPLSYHHEIHIEPRSPGASRAISSRTHRARGVAAGPERAAGCISAAKRDAARPDRQRIYRAVRAVPDGGPGAGARAVSAGAAASRQRTQGELLLPERLARRLLRDPGIRMDRRADRRPRARARYPGRVR